MVAPIPTRIFHGPHAAIPDVSNAASLYYLSRTETLTRRSRNMNKILLGIGIGLATSIFWSGIVAAQDLQEVVVTAKGDLATKPAGKTASGAPIVDMSISYGVSYAGLDLASAAGAAEIERRVTDAAKQACKEIAAKRPFLQFTTSEDQCAKAAADKAMVRVQDLEAAAAKQSAK
jgi:UrcA family protein